MILDILPIQNQDPKQIMPNQFLPQDPIPARLDTKEFQITVTYHLEPSLTWVQWANHKPRMQCSRIYSFIRILSKWFRLEFIIFSTVVFTSLATESVTSFLAKSKSPSRFNQTTISFSSSNEPIATRSMLRFARILHNIFTKKCTSQHEKRSSCTPIWTQERKRKTDLRLWYLSQAIWSTQQFKGKLGTFFGTCNTSQVYFGQNLTKI